MFYILMFPFGGALVARLRHQLWPVWAIWVGCSVAAIVVLWTYGDFRPALIWTLAASAAGFIAPELWTSCRGFVSHPRVFGWILGATAVIFLVFHQGALGSVLLLGIIFLALHVMLQPLFRRSGQRAERRGHH